MLPLYFIAFAWEVSFLSYSLFIDRSMLRILKRDTCRKDSRTFPVDCLNLSIFFSSQRCIMAVKTIDIEGKWVVKCSHWKDLRKKVSCTLVPSSYSWITIRRLWLPLASDYEWWCFHKNILRWLRRFIFCSYISIDVLCQLHRLHRSDFLYQANVTFILNWIQSGFDRRKAYRRWLNK